MLAVNNCIRQGAMGIVLSIVLLVCACDDENNHQVTEIIKDNVETGYDWNFYNEAPATHEGFVDLTVAASGSSSLAIKSTKAEASGFSYWWLGWAPQDIPVGASLELKVNVKVTNVTGAGVFISLRGDGDPGSVIFFETTQDKQKIDGTADFATYTLKLNKYPKEVKHIYIFLTMHASSTGTANFDDISLISHH